MNLQREEESMGDFINPNYVDPDFVSPDPVDEINRIQDNPPERVMEDDTDDDREGGTILDDEIGRDKQLDR